MNKTVKVTLIVGAILVAIGIILVVIAGFAGGWNLVSSDWEEKVYEAPQDVEITDLDVDFSAGSLEIGFYKGDVIKVEYPENEQVTMRVSVKDNTLHITSVIHWHVQFGWFNPIPATKVYIPYETNLGLKLNIDAGTVTVKAGSFKNIDIKMDAGTLKMSNVFCNNFDVKMNAGTMNLTAIECSVFSANLNAGTLNATHLRCYDANLELSAGTVKVGIDGVKSEYSVLTDVTTGSCNVKSQTGTTLKCVRVKVSAGTAKITFER